MSATISLTSASSDLVDYLELYAANPPSNPYGSFNPSTAPYDQWVRGDSSSAFVSVLDGDFTSYSGGNLTGTAESLTFGYGLDYDAATGLYSVAETELTVDFNSADVDAGPDSFDYAVYGLIQNDPSYVYDYFADAGTEQNGTSGADTLYSFGGTDILNGGDGLDTFVFDLDRTNSTVIGDDTITDFQAGSDGEQIVLSLDDAAYDSYAEILAASTDTSDGVLIDLGDYGSITLAGVATADLTTDNFAFV